MHIHRHTRQLLAAALSFGTLACSLHPVSDDDHLSLRQADNTTPIYQDASYSVDERVEDLLQRMTVEEKAGTLFHTQVNMPADYTFTEGDSNDILISQNLLNHFNLAGNILDATKTAEFTNAIQRRAMNGRLGIPITLSSDPRHSFTENVGTGFAAGTFSQWPESLGLAALRSPELVQQFADIARQEYLAVGLRAALHPQVDLSTEPRWARIGNTWGEDATLTSELLAAYITGFHHHQAPSSGGSGLNGSSVSTITKHFPGGGPMENGEDSHFVYGKNQTYPGANFDYHLRPFRAAIAAGARQIMPYYSRPIGTLYEPVGFSFNREIVTTLLREELGFTDGVVVTDWGLITDTVILGQDMPARAWGLEHTTELERVVRILDAGCDQFGGESRTELVVQAVSEGLVPEARLDVSVRRLLREKFLLGLFESPYVDAAAASSSVGTAEFVALGAETQRRAYTLLTNQDGTLPITDAVAATATFYVEGFNASYLTARNLSVVATPAEASYALLRFDAPYEPRPGGFEAQYHAGSLAFNASEQARQAAIYAAVPSVVDIKLDRPAVIPEVAERAAALLGSYGSGPDAFLDVVFGVSAPEGKLPFDLPRSMEAVENAFEDVPYDTVDPVFKFGDGLSY